MILFAISNTFIKWHKIAIAYIQDIVTEILAVNKLYIVKPTWYAKCCGMLSVV